MSSEGPRCVFLWAVPRSLATAMAKCMSSVAGVQVWNGPYQHVFLKEKLRALATSEDEEDKFIAESTNAAAKPLAQRISEIPVGKNIDTKFFEYPWLKTQLETEDQDKSLIFVKDIAHLLDGKYDFLPTERKFRHTFLIRNPNNVYKSLSKILFDITPEEYKGNFDLLKNPLYEADRIFQGSRDLWKHVRENLDSDPVVIDADELAANPEKLLPKYFEAIGVPWKDDYLTWVASDDVTMEWKAPYQALATAKVIGTHEDALGSTHFVPRETVLPSRDDMSDDVIKCIDEAMPIYEEMYQQRIKP